MTTPANQAPTGGLTPHLTIRDRRAKEAIDFYGKAFGATEIARMQKMLTDLLTERTPQ